MSTQTPSPVTLAVANQKGGVAKTTSVASIGAALAELGHRVLLVDLDPQACLTFSLGIDPEDLETSVHHVLTQGVDPTEVILETEDGVDLLPATIELARAEADLLTRTGREHVIRGALEQLEVIEPPIPKTIKFAEAPAAGRSILATSRSNKGAQAYREVARNLVERAKR